MEVIQLTMKKYEPRLKKTECFFSDVGPEEIFATLKDAFAARN